MRNNYFSIILSLLFLLGTGYIYADTFCPDPQIDEIKSELKDIKADISFLNLLNGLYLTVPQMEALLEKLHEVEKINKEADKEYAEAYWKVQDHYKKIRMVLMENQGIPTEVEMKGWKYDGSVYAMYKVRDKKLAKIEQEVKNDILNPNQITIINDFVDCLFPPKSLKNPIRVGQVPDIGEIEKKLNRIRNTKEKD